MKVAIVTSTELDDRWDAPFHVTRTEPTRPAQEGRDRVAELRSLVTADDAVSRLDALTVADRTPLIPLLRGEAKPTAKSLRDVAKRYPHLALALMEREADRIALAIADRLKAEQASLATIRSLTKPSVDRGARTAFDGLRAGHAYPFNDPCRFDDDDGQGFAYALVPDHESGSGGVRMAWVVDAQGEPHPGYASSTVPVAPGDVDRRRGFPLTLTPSDPARPTLG